MLVAIVLSIAAPLVRQAGGAAAAGEPARVVFTGWNVGARPRVCTVAANPAASTCADLPITDGSPDGTSGATVADLNEDGRTDVIVTNENGTINTCLDNGAGGWTCQSNGGSGRHNGVVAADLNGDANVDLVGVIETLNQMDVCLGNGAGAFTCTRQAAPLVALRIQAFDPDGDGDTDLALASADSGVSVCLNDGAAAFTCSSIAGIATAHDVGVGDFDADGDADLAVASWGQDDQVCLGSGTGAFTCAVSDTGGDDAGLDVADFDQDGSLDIVRARYGQVSRVCIGNGAGAFACSDLNATAGSWRDADIADVTGDGVPDLAVALAGQNLICAGDGLGNVTGCVGIDTPTWHSMGVAVINSAVADSDGDGVPDPADNCTAVVNASQLDTDGDTAGDACDVDDDGDGLSDADETGVHGTDPLLTDTDGDGWSDWTEVVLYGSNPLLPPQPQTVTVTGPSAWDATSGSFSVTVSASSGLPAVVSVSGPCTVNGTDVTPTAAGVCDVTGDQAGDADWLIAAATHTVSLDPGVQTITLSGPATLTVGQTGSITASSESGLPIDVSMSGPCSITGLTVTANGVGACTVSAGQPGDALWSAAPVGDDRDRDRCRTDHHDQHDHDHDHHHHHDHHADHADHADHDHARAADDGRIDHDTRSDPDHRTRHRSAHDCRTADCCTHGPHDDHHLGTAIHHHDADHDELDHIHAELDHVHDVEHVHLDVDACPARRGVARRHDRRWPARCRK